MSRHTSTTTGRLRVFLAPSRDDMVDAGCVTVLMLLALIGFRTTFSGSHYLVAGLVGTILGVLIAHLANVVRQPLIAVAAMTVVVFFLAGGAIALRHSAVAGVLPNGATFHGLADESVHGWKDLLTTLPPVDDGGPLAVLPYLLGLLGGVGGFCLARRIRYGAAPVAAPLAVLVAVILLGTASPAARLLQGALFGSVALGWMTLRAQRSRPTARSGSGRLVRWSTVAVLLGVAFAGAAVIGPHVPGAASRHRTVLRSYVEPPFDVGQYPSPLAGYRKYTRPAKESLWGADLFRVSGLPPGTYVRIATMDAYDGLTWKAANAAGQAGAMPDTFQRVGTEIDDPSDGRAMAFTVQIDDGYADVWLPDAGSLTRLSFTGTRAGAHAEYFRYDLATDTGIVPDRLAAGDRYAASTRLPRHYALTSADQVAQGSSLGDASAFLKAQATNWSGKSSSATARILALADHLRQIGHFTDGEKPNSFYLPGHSQSRLLKFVNGSQIVGDDEQYAAAFALMIDQLGTPARVVLGARLPSGRSVKGKDVRAWVEVRLADGSWRALLPDTFMDRNRPPTLDPPQQRQDQAGKVVPPPARTRPRSSLADAADSNARSRATQKKHAGISEAGGVPAWLTALGKWGGPPVLLLVLVCSAIVGVKALRRRRRRRLGTPAVRLAAGWLEVVDHARDLGSTVLMSGTRREQARLLAGHDLTSLAHAADAHVFGVNEPDDAVASTFWRQVDDTRRRMSAAVGPGTRVRAALNLASLRRRRRIAGEHA